MEKKNFLSQLQNKEQPKLLESVYKLLNVSTPLEMNKKYGEEDQILMKTGAWDYDNPNLITNKVKGLLEKIPKQNLTKEELYWRENILWFWNHHAISCAIWNKKDLAAAKFYSEIALKTQPNDSPNKITKLLYLLIRDQLAEAKEHIENISDETEKASAKSLLEEYELGKFFEKADVNKN